MSAHTKEPWYLGAQNDALYIIAGSKPAEGNDYLVHDADRTVIAGMKAIGHERNYVNARRIVACVNACKGIDTKFLEEVLLAGEEPALYAHTLMQQRDELLELAKLVRKELVAFADDLKTCSTVGGEWDGSEHEAKEEYDRLMALAAKLAEKVEAAQ